MIISRKENNNIIKGYYDSSNILVSEYDTTTRNLSITFKHGGVYKYLGVPNKDYYRFELAESQGKVLNSHIKSTFDVEQMDSVNPAEIKRELKQIREEEIASFEQRIIELMSQIRVAWFQNGESGLDAKLMKELDKTREALAKL